VSLEEKIIHAATNGDMATVRESLMAMHPQDHSRILSACEWIRDEDLKMRWEDDRDDELPGLLRDALLPGTDVVDEHEGPVIIAWALDPLVDFLAGNMRRIRAGSQPLSVNDHVAHERAEEQP
jgi:hypothetical protein